MPFDSDGAAALAKYEVEADAVLTSVEAFVVENFGGRCSTFDGDCATCKVWAAYDVLLKTIG